MSRIALTPNASGTGTLTIAAPNTNSDRTLTLPDATGTVNISGLANQVPAGSAGAPAIYSTGDTNTGIYFPAADTVSISTAGSEGLRVTPGGQTYVNGALGLGGPNYGNPADIMLSNGSGSPGIWLAASSVVASYVGTATAGLAYGAVGTYGFFRGPTGSAVTPGTTYAGSSLQASSFMNSGTYASTITSGGNAGAPSGTWRAVGGSSSSTAGVSATTVFLRIS